MEVMNWLAGALVVALIIGGMSLKQTFEQYPPIVFFLALLGFFVLCAILHWQFWYMRLIWGLMTSLLLGAMLLTLITGDFVHVFLTR
jgi:hypothetical protein